MKVNRPAYKERKHTDPTDGYDVAELKFDGIWGHARLAEARIEVFSRQGNQKDSWSFDGGVGPAESRLHGEFMFASNWAHRTGRLGQYHVFDCTSFKGEDISDAPLRERRLFAEKLVSEMDCERTMMVPQFDLVSFPVDVLWEEMVDEQGFEGLILKDTNGSFGSRWGRLKKSFTVDYVCMGFNEGAGRLSGMAGSIKAGLYNDEGALTEVCRVSGISDVERQAFWDNPDDYIGRVFVAHGKTIFKTCALRHPNYGGWHAEKTIEECTFHNVRVAAGYE